jgi:hypothetical protein
MVRLAAKRYGHQIDRRISQALKPDDDRIRDVKADEIGRFARRFG